MVGKMFPFVTAKTNPIGGKCFYDCYDLGCWAKDFATRYHMEKYAREEPFIVWKELERKFKPSDFVFIGDMNDHLGSWVPSAYIKTVIDLLCRTQPDVHFLWHTKNAHRYGQLWEEGIEFPINCTLGCTVETNRAYVGVSKAVFAPVRLQQMALLKSFGISNDVLLTAEPIMDFDLDEFAKSLIAVKPWAVAVGYDNYGCKLPEPSLEKTLQFIGLLERAGVRVFRKSLREAWNA